MILAEPDPAARVRGAARWITVLYSTDFDVVRILDAASDEDAETQCCCDPSSAAGTGS